MATKWISPTWRMPEESNQSKFDNYSMSFDSASNNWIELTESSSVFNGLTAFSVSLWLNPSATQAAYTSPFSFQSATTQYLKLNFGATPSNNQLEIAFRNSATARATSSVNSIPLNTWTNVIVVFNASSSLSLYVNGSLDGQDTTSLPTSAVQSTNIYIGTDAGSTTGRDFNGKLDQVAIFDYALSTDQINYLYNSGTPQNPMAIPGNSPIAYYPLGGSSTGSASTLTIPNESVPSATVFDFDGGSWISTGIGLTDLNISTQFTLSLWVKIQTNTLYDNIISAPTSTNVWDNGFGIYLTGSALIFWVEDWNDPNHFATSATLNNDQWYHVCCTFSTSNGLKLYIDAGTPTTASNTDIDGLTNDLFIGSSGNAATRALNGNISNVSLFNTALPATGTESVASLYNYGTLPNISSYSNLKAWYKLNVDTSTWDGSDWEIGNSATGYTTAFDFKDGFESSPLTLADSFETSFNPNGYTKLTFSVWAYVDRFHDKNTFIATFENTSNKYADNNVGITTSSSVLYISINGNSICGVNVGGAFSSITPDDVWNSITIVYDGTFTDADIAIQNAGRLKFYSNGVYKAFNSFINNVPSSIIANGLGTRIGARNPTLSNPSSRSALVGKLSNLQIWNESLTLSEVIDVYNNGTPLQSNIPQSGSLKAWWKMDSNNSAWNGSNWSITDSSGEGNTGTSYGMVESNLIDSLVTRLNGISSGMTTANLVNSDLTRSIPYSSYSMEFDGTADYVSCGSVDETEGITTMSISGWFNPQASGVGGAAGIIAKETRDWYVGWYSSPANSIRFLISDDNGSTNDALNSLTLGTNANVLNKWHHFVCTWDASDKLKIYINGVLSSETNSVNANSALPTSTNNVEIGRRVATYFDGNLSNIAIWTSVLTEDQILTIYNGGVPNSISSLSPVSWWSLAGDSYYNGTDWICPDLGSANNNGTSDNMGGEELIGNGPGSTANGIATSMDIPANLKGNAPNSSKNAFSVNMNSADRVEDVPA